MAAVHPISFDEKRNQGYTVEQLLTWHRKDLSESEQDADASSSGSSASESDSEGSSSSSELSSEVSSSSDSSGDSSDQEDDSIADSALDSDASSSYFEEDTGGHFPPNEGGRPAETLVYRRPTRPLDTPKSLTTCVVDTLGDMARTDNVGFIAWLVPITGICTMLGTEFLACVNHFSCSENFPTLSYAATFRPEGYAFTGGMCLTALFIFTSVSLFFWYLRLRITSQNQQEGERITTKHVITGYASLLAGVTAAISLFGLAVMDMRSYHDAHINFTIVFFIAAWVTMIAVQIARKSILHEDEEGKATSTALSVVLRQRSFWRSLRRWRRLDFFTAYTLGRLLLNTGLASTFLFGLFFLCANGVWSNPLGFTAVQEAFFEALAIVCQLLFMGTLSCELARLTRLVEQRDYLELERRE